MNRQSENLALLTAAVLMGICGCTPQGGKSETVAEGIIYYVEYQMEGDRTGGFTRVNSAAAVPGRNGSWNIDAYGMWFPRQWWQSDSVPFRETCL